MENKRDASSAGLPWPTTSTRSSQNMSTPAESPVVTSPSALTSMPSAPLETLTSTSGTDTLAPSGMYTAEPHPDAPFPGPDPQHSAPHRHPRFTERVVHQIHFKIFTHTPTMSENFLLKKYPLREFPGVEILNISSMVFQEIGNGRSKPRITGAIILKSPYYMETILIDTLVLRLFHLQAAEDTWQLSQTWPGSYWNH